MDCIQNLDYCTGPIIIRGLYIFYPIVEDHFFVLKKVFSENSGLMYDWYSRAVSNQEQVMIVGVKYSYFLKTRIISKHVWILLESSDRRAYQRWPSYQYVEKNQKNLRDKYFTVLKCYYLAGLWSASAVCYICLSHQ